MEDFEGVGTDCGGRANCLAELPPTDNKDWTSENDFQE
jgi:hypothetical protein